MRNRWRHTPEGILVPEDFGKPIKLCSGMLLGGFFSGPGGASFNPTILGDSWGTAHVDLVVDADADDTQKGPANSDSETHLWLVASASDIEIRVAADWNGSTGSTGWYNPAGVDQGAPDVDRVPGTTVFQLGVRDGVTVNLYTAYDDTPTEAGLTKTKLGTFTDDDQVTYFNPTNATDYGYRLDASADDPGNTNVFGTLAIQFTFKKTGYDPYTITMEMEASASASQEAP